MRPNRKGTSRPRQRQNAIRLRFAALDASHNGTKIYLAAISIKTLFPLCQVSRGHEDLERGYQRLLGRRRPAEIAAYLDSGKVIPGAVILSARPQARLQFDEQAREVSFLRVKPTFLVIDGQHRLFGAHLAKHDVPIVVSILALLDRRQEVTYFLDVHRKQRGVPKALQIEVAEFLAGEEDLKQL